MFSNSTFMAMVEIITSYNENKSEIDKSIKLVPNKHFPTIS
jgi:hypothetical protein